VTSAQNRKGIILAGGAGSRLHPITAAISKQMVPVYDKPMIYYPLSTLMLSGIREYLVITTPRDIESFRGLLGDGSQWGISVDYATQARPEGIAQAFLIGADFLAGAQSALVLGDNIFFGHNLSETLQNACRRTSGATIFGYPVQDPERYGVARFDATGQVVDLVEKAAKPPSDIAITGIYFYDSQVVNIARSLQPSARGELEITDLNRVYLQRKQLHPELLGRGNAWLDTGTFAALQDAGNFVRILEERQGLKVACVEEIAYRMGFIDADRVRELAEPLRNSGYGRYLLRILEDRPSI
jgi:glucose-1-phosphate thymidylyltransferase